MTYRNDASHGILRETPIKAFEKKHIYTYATVNRYKADVTEHSVESVSLFSSVLDVEHFYGSLFVGDTGALCMRIGSDRCVEKGIKGWRGGASEQGGWQTVREE